MRPRLLTGEGRAEVADSKLCQDSHVPLPPGRHVLGARGQGRQVKEERGAGPCSAPTAVLLSHPAG